MIKIGDTVEDIIKGDHEALFCLSRRILNLSRYARRIHPLVENSTKKEVKIPSIIMALSRLGKKIKGVKPLLQEAKIDGITVKSPLAEVVFEKTTSAISRLATIQKAIKLKSDEWFSFSQNSKSIIIICGEDRTKTVIDNMGNKPILILKDLTALGLSISPEYHSKPNITFTLLHRIAEKEIPLTDLFTTRDEMIFLFETKYLPQLMGIFKKG